MVVVGVNLNRKEGNRSSSSRLWWWSGGTDSSNTRVAYTEEASCNVSRTSGLLLLLDQRRLHTKTHVQYSTKGCQKEGRKEEGNLSIEFQTREHANLLQAIDRVSTLERPPEADRSAVGAFLRAKRRATLQHVLSYVARRCRIFRPTHDRLCC